MPTEPKTWRVRVVRWVQEETSVEVQAVSERAARRAALRKLREARFTGDPDAGDVWDFNGEGGTPRTVDAEEISSDGG